MDGWSCLAGVEEAACEVLRFPASHLFPCNRRSSQSWRPSSSLRRCFATTQARHVKIAGNYFPSFEEFAVLQQVDREPKGHRITSRSSVRGRSL